MERNGRVGRKPEKGKIRVRCLPIAGIENPYQHLMMRGLRQCTSLDVRHGAPGKFFAGIRTCLLDRPDVLHYDWIQRYFIRRHWVWTLLNAPVFLLEIAIVKAVFSCRVVWTMHNLVAHDAGSDSIELWVRRCFGRMCEWIRVFDESTVARASELIGVNESSFRVLPEGSYVDYYPNDIDPRAARRRLNLREDALVLLYLGQIRPYKGIEDLIEAFAAVGRPHWRLLIAGSPIDRRYSREIEDRAQSVQNVNLHLKFVGPDDLKIFFNASDVVVLPFRRVENSGSAVLAMGFAKPIVAPKMGVLVSRLEQQEELLYEEPRMLKDALEKIASYSGKQLEHLGKANFEAVTGHSWLQFAAFFVPQETTIRVSERASARA